MKLKTHMLIARKIHEYLDENYEVNISRRHFIFGSIKPDLVRKFKTLKHSIHDSLDFVLGEVTKHDETEDSLKRSSVHLGVINHYLSDFFCSKHYYKNDGEGLIKHIKYEGRLHKKIAAMDAGGKLELPYLHVADNFVGSFGDILKALEEEYKKQPPSIENDILFAIFAPLAACRYLFSDSFISQEVLKQAA